MSIIGELYAYGKMFGYGSGISPSNMTIFRAIGVSNGIKLYICGPEDSVVNRQTLCTVAGVKVVRSTTTYPKTPGDGTLILDLKREDLKKYASDPYLDTNVAQGTTYYYSAFPYSDNGVFNYSEKNRCDNGSKNYELYGYDEDQSDSNPLTRITYPQDVDNYGFTNISMDLSTGAMNLNSWKDAFFVKYTRPVMLKSNGDVDYELDHNDQTLKKGTTEASDISNASYDGNAMVEFPKMYFKRWTDSNNVKHVRVCNVKLDDDYKCYQHMYNGKELDVIYLPMFEGSYINKTVRSIAGQTPMNTNTGETELIGIQANGAGWIFDDFMNKQMIKDLLFLMARSSDAQSKFGNGHKSGGTAAGSLFKTGTIKDKGMFYGTSGNVAVKVFWLENYYGDRWDRTDGIMYNNGHVIVKPYPPYNTTGEGYFDTGITITGTSGGYIKTTKMTEYGDIPTVCSGSSSTYIPDGCWFNNSGLRFGLWGGDCNDDLLVGPAALALGSELSNSDWAFGPSLSYKKPILA